MIGYKVIYLLLFINVVHGEEKSVLPQNPKEASFMSKLTGWLFPFGQSEPKAEETLHSAPQYLPPPGKVCNPCNQSPWIPMASNVGHHTVINFEPPSSQYGVPTPLQNYPPIPDLKPPPVFKPPPPKPIYSDPIGGMLPPPLNGDVYHSLPTNEYSPPPPPPPPLPVDSYVSPVQNPLVINQNTHPVPLVDSYGNPIQNQLVDTKPALPSPIQNQIFAAIENQPPPPPPSQPVDSYGVPIQHQHLDYPVRQEYLPSLEQLPLSSVAATGPVPLPNLSRSPVLPLHSYQAFNEIKQPVEVQVIPSVKIADFLASVDHPINIVQSPLVEVHVTQNQSQVEEPADVRPGGFYDTSAARLSDNPIVVEDSHVAASSLNATKTTPNIIRSILKTETEKGAFTTPTLDFTEWKPFDTAGTLPIAMLPPTPGPSTWVNTETTTKKPIQIIIPYRNSNKKPKPFEVKYSTLHPVYSPPPPSVDVWTKFIEDFRLAESQRITATAFTSTTQVYNIQDLLKGTKHNQDLEKAPFDVISLRNNIDDWTQQEYSKSLEANMGGKSSTLVKKIPDNYFTTVSPGGSETTTRDQYEGASSNRHENDLDSDLSSESVTEQTDGSTSATTVTEGKDDKSLWDVQSVTVSPITKEKVYVVTPQSVSTTTQSPPESWSMSPQVSLKGANSKNESGVPKFLVRVDPEDKSSRDKLLKSTGPLTVVFSEWPHLINNLQTTTRKPMLVHPLMGLMGYQPPPNSTVHTITGHSKVVTVVTPATTRLRRVGY